MNAYEIYKAEDGRYWLVSTHSCRYHEIITDKLLQAFCHTRNEAFSWLELRNVKPGYEDENGYYEIYV